MKTQHTPGPLKVIPDYAWQGRHPLHDARFVATSNDVEITERGEDEDPPRSWRFTNREDSIICTMTDCEHQKEYAHLFAAAPEMKQALEAWVKFWDDMPKGQLANVVCDIGLLNDAFLKTSAALAKAKS